MVESHSLSSGDIRKGDGRSDPHRQRLDVVRHHNVVRHAKQTAVMKAASTFILSALALNLFQRNNQPSAETVTDTSLSVNKPQQPDYDNPVPRVIPFVDRVASEKVERVPVALPPEKIGVLIDTTIDNLSHHHISLKPTDKGTFNVVAFATIKEQKKAGYSTPADIDNLTKISSKVTGQEFSEFIEDWKKQLRQYGRTNGFPFEYIIPATQTVASKNSIAIAEVPKDAEIVFRIDLGTQNSPQMQWLGDMLTKHTRLLHEIESYLVADPMANFLREATTDPNTGRFDTDAKETFLRLFTLTPNDRRHFFDAIRSNDLPKAKRILTFRTVDTILSEDLYYALLNYRQSCQNNDSHINDITSSLKNGVLNVAYDHLDKDSDEIEYASPELKILKSSLTEKQFEKLEGLPPHIFNIIITSLFDEKKPSLTYSEITSLLDTTISGPQDESKSSVYKTPDILNAHTLQSIRMFMGSRDFTSDSPSGWLNRTEKHNNMLSVLSLLQASDLIRQNTANIGRDVFTAFGGSLQRRDGHVYLVLPIDTKIIHNDPSRAALSEIAKSTNNRLGALLALLNAAHSQTSPAMDLPDTRGAALPLYDRVMRYFAEDNGDFYISSPTQLLRMLKKAGIELKATAREAKNEHKNEAALTALNNGIDRTTPSITISGFTIRDIVRLREQGSHTASIEAEVKLPSSGAATGR